jgi:anthranilate synthase component 1
LHACDHDPLLPEQGQRVFSQAGGGVVADSRPEDEVQEVKNKLGALKLALLKAEGI